MFTKNNSMAIYALLFLMSSFFELHVLTNSGLLYWVNRSLVLAFLIIGWRFKDTFSGLIKWYILAILLSLISSNYFHGQSIMSTYKESYVYMELSFYFALIYLRPSLATLNKVIISFSVLFCLCYIAQWLIYPVVIFNGAIDEYNITDEIFRMRMPCTICSYLLVYWGINKFILIRRYKYLLYSVLGSFPILILSFRSLTGTVVLCSILMSFFVSNKLRGYVKAIIPIVVVGYVLWNVPIVQERVNTMFERYERDKSGISSKEYIRFIEYEYYTEIIFTNPVANIFGNGMPVGDGHYSKAMQLAEDSRLYWNDLGLSLTRFVIGHVATILLVILYGFAIYRARSSHLQYIRFTLLTALVTSIWSLWEIFRNSNFLIAAILIYIIKVEQEQAQASMGRKG